MVSDSHKTPAAFYRIEVAGRIAAERADWFDGLALIVEATSEGGAITVLSGRLPDQAALFGVLNRIRDLGLRLISVNREEAQ